MVIEWVLPFSKLGSPGREAGAGMGRRGLSLATVCVQCLWAGLSRRRWRYAVLGSGEIRAGDRNGAVTSSQ